MTFGGCGGYFLVVVAMIFGSCGGNFVAVVAVTLWRLWW